MPFEKGKSGNPNGRPKKHESITNIIKEYLDKKTSIKDEKTGRRKRIKHKEILVRKAFALAIQGDISAIKFICNYHDGMPKQQIDLGGKVGNSILEGLSNAENFEIKDNGLGDVNGSSNK